MINLYKQSDIRTKSKTMYPVNKSHIASMNLKINTDTITPEPQLRQPFKNATNRIDLDNKHEKSGHKYKKSLILQESTIHLVKKSSQIYSKNKDMGMSTERLSKENPRKRSIDYGVTRIKTQMDQPKQRVQVNTVEINVDDLREMVCKLKNLKLQKQMLKRQLGLFKKCLKKNTTLNPVLRALAPL